MNAPRRPALILLALLLALGACGGDEPAGGQRDEPASEEGTEPHVLPPLTAEQLPGVYVWDRERTLRGDQPALGTNPAPASEEGEYRLDLEEDGTFVFEVGAGEFAFTLKGTWEAENKTIRIRTTEVDGEPADEETSVEESLILEGRGLVLEQEDRRIYMRRLEEAPLAD